MLRIDRLLITAAMLFALGTPALADSPTKDDPASRLGARQEPRSHKFHHPGVYVRELPPAPVAQPSKSSSLKQGGRRSRQIEIYVTHDQVESVSDCAIGAKPKAPLVAKQSSRNKKSLPKLREYTTKGKP